MRRLMLAAASRQTGNGIDDTAGMVMTPCRLRAERSGLVGFGFGFGFELTIARQVELELPVDLVFLFDL